MAGRLRKENLTAPRLIALVLLALVVVIQEPLWIGKGSYKNLAELTEQLEEQKQRNKELQLKLAKLSSEAESLREGSQALESRARSRMNMIKENEVLIRISP